MLRCSHIRLILTNDLRATERTNRVGLWAVDGPLLASNSVTVDSTLANQTRYEPIGPVILTLTETCYAGAFAPSGVMVINAFGPKDGHGQVNMAPEIHLRFFVFSVGCCRSFAARHQVLPGRSALSQSGVTAAALQNLCPSAFIRG